jgi:hypothetical protein
MAKKKPVAEFDPSGNSSRIVMLPFIAYRYFVVVARNDETDEAITSRVLDGEAGDAVFITPPVEHQRWSGTWSPPSVVLSEEDSVSFISQVPTLKRGG